MDHWHKAECWNSRANIEIFYFSLYFIFTINSFSLWPAYTLFKRIQKKNRNKTTFKHHVGKANKTKMLLLKKKEPTWINLLRTSDRLGQYVILGTKNICCFGRIFLLHTINEYFKRREREKRKMSCETWMAH